MRGTRRHGLRAPRCLRRSDWSALQRKSTVQADRQLEQVVPQDHRLVAQLRRGHPHFQAWKGCVQRRQHDPAFRRTGCPPLPDAFDAPHPVHDARHPVWFTRWPSAPGARRPMTLCTPPHHDGFTPDASHRVGAYSARCRRTGGTSLPLTRVGPARMVPYPAPLPCAFPLDRTGCDCRTDRGRVPAPAEPGVHRHGAQWGGGAAQRRDRRRAAVWGPGDDRGDVGDAQDWYGGEVLAEAVTARLRDDRTGAAEGDELSEPRGSRTCGPGPFGKMPSGRGQRGRGRSVTSASRR